MEHFYQLLKQYNLEFRKNHSNIPEWFFQYTEIQPPKYWQTVYNILKEEDRSQSIIEVGAGYGDVTALLYAMGFTNIQCFERDKKLISCIEDKINILFHKPVHVINKTYPCELDFTPDIIIQVNCNYADSLTTKLDYIEQTKNIHKKNGIPKVYILEVIDDNYKENNSTFPEFMRLSSYDIINMFPNSRLESYLTYKYPQNKVSKTLYKICK